MATEALEQTLGRGVRTRRIDARLTQVELAERANVSLGALKHLESGEGSTISTLVKVLRALGAEDWLDTLSPPDVFDPLRMLDQPGRGSGLVARPRRVRHPRSGE